MVVEQQLESARLELLDMGLRSNPQLNYRSGGKALDIIDEQSAKIFALLVEQESPLSFLPLPEAYQQKIADDEDEGSFFQADDAAELPPLDLYLEQKKGSARFSDKYLQTGLIPAKLDKALLKLETEAHTMLQEQGVEVLYLALGFLQWNEPANASVSRYAPLILVPVELTRSSARDSFKLRYTGEELGSNLTLAAKLRTEFKLILPAYTDEMTVSDYYQAVSDAIAAQPSWRVHPDKIGLGLFSFGKFQMYMDLDPSGWPEGKKPSQLPLIGRLFRDGFDHNPEINPDDLNHPEKLHLVKDADSSQIEAILAMKSGADLIIQGPPGTGKSQTITNIIAEAVALGKKVLFVAQKMAALEVVKKRLDETHLGFAVLELHSHKSTKKAVLGSIAESLEQGRPQTGNRQQELADLAQAKTSLDAYVQAIRAPILQSGLNYIEALGALLQLKAQDPDNLLPALPFSCFKGWTAEQYSTARKLVTDLVQQLARVGVPAAHPFAMSGRTDFSPALQQALTLALTETSQLLSQLDTQTQTLSAFLQLEQPPSLQQVTPLIATTIWLAEVPELKSVKVNNPVWAVEQKRIENGLSCLANFLTLKAYCDERFIAQALDADLLRIRQGLIGKTDKWWRFLSSDYRQAKATLAGLWRGALPASAADWLTSLDTALAYQSAKKELASNHTLLSEVFGSQWQGEFSDHHELSQIQHWISDFYQKVGQHELPQSLAALIDAGIDKKRLRDHANALTTLCNGLTVQAQTLKELIQIQPQIQTKQPSHDLTAVPFSQLNSWLEGWKNSALLYDFARYNQIIQAFAPFNIAPFNITPFTDLAYPWHHAPELLLTVFELSYYRGLVDHAYDSSDAIRQFDRTKHEQSLQDFKRIDGNSLFFAQELLVNRLYERLPKKTAKGEMELVLRELGKKKRHIPIRKLLAEAGNVIQQAKPIFMMSPMSIATYLKQGALDFDLVIFDEASQITAPDALGAMLRGRQVIVVGDSKQMPPSNLFGKAVELEEEELEQSATAEMESILALMEARGAASKMLRWHYRSRHDSLIAVSNDQFYKNKLVAFPSPGFHPDATGLKFHHLPETHYDKGGSRTNPGEVKTVVAAVLQHALTKPHLSLGVVAFSLSQRDAILLELEKERRLHPETDEFFARHAGGDEFFVKNLENVQGDERDVIYISICYGKTSTGQLSQNFGLLNKPGGERRLNVLISRARLAMEVFANFKGDELKVEADSPFGVRSLQIFLQFAESGQLNKAHEKEQQQNFAFGALLHQAIQRLGYQVATRVGSQGYYIDLAIKHPQDPTKFVLALEYDGAGYYEAASARDRERLRQSVLEGLGWTFERIWSTDWFRDPEAELQRLQLLVDKAITQHDELMLSMAAQANSSIRQVKQQVAAPEVVAAPILRVEEEQPEFEACTTPYKKTDVSKLNIPAVDDFSAIPLSMLVHAVERIVETEYPIFANLVATRLASAAGLTRVGAKIKRTVDQAIASAVAKGLIQLDKDEVLWPHGRSTVKLRNWNTADTATRKLENVCDAELTNALLLTVQDAHAISVTDAASAALGLLGFQRATAQAAERMAKLAQVECEKGVLVLENERLKIAVNS
jgi:very-short-patch-repair endonuclease/DNA polymerase III delta prime subunit